MLRILIVDDEAPIRDWIAYSIKKSQRHFEVVAACKSGQEAYGLILQEKPDVVISDIRMPGISGLELMKMVKEVLPHTYFLVITNYAEFSYAKEAISIGTVEYLLKSELRSQELLHILDEIDLKKTSVLAEKEYNLKNKGEIDLHSINENDEKAKTKNYSKRIDDALDFIHKNYNKDISLVSVANHFYISPEHFSRLFKSEVGQSFSGYLIMYRLNKAEYLLNNTDMPISEIAYQVGYSLPSYFSRLYKKYIGVSPNDSRMKYKKQ